MRMPSNTNYCGACPVTVGKRLDGAYCYLIVYGEIRTRCKRCYDQYATDWHKIDGFERVLSLEEGRALFLALEVHES